MDDFVKIQLEFEGNIFADLVSGFGFQFKSTYSALCERGILSVNRAFSIEPDSKSSITIISDEGENTIIIKEADQFKLMIDSFCNDILSKKIGYNFQAVIFHQKIIDLAYRSALSKTLIEI